MSIVKLKNRYYFAIIDVALPHKGGVEMEIVSKQDIEHVAELARLTFTEEEKEKYTKQLNAFLTFAKKLEEVDTTDVSPTTHVLELQNVFREDKVRPSLPVEEVLKHAPEHED